MASIDQRDERTDGSQRRSDPGESAADRAESATERAESAPDRAESATEGGGSVTDRSEDAQIAEVLTALDQVGSEWRLRVLAALHGGEQRFNDLKRATDASSSTLSRVLEALEDLDLVTRRVEERPIATYYSLTQKGAALCPVWEAMADWSAEWVACETEAHPGQ